MDANRATARKAEKADFGWIGDVLTRAFHDDPASCYAMPSPDKRAKRSPRLFRAQARVVMDKGQVWVDSEQRGAALWSAPGRWKDDFKHVVMFFPLLFLIGRDLPRATRVLRVLEAAHPERPHWYLDAIGTDPVHQGRGVGGALLAPVLTECDASRVGAFLVASSPDNVPFYRRHGFEVTETHQIPEGPPLFSMWRDPAQS